MTDSTPPDIDEATPDDRRELISAVLDGEATASEVERVEADPTMLAELEQMRALADAVSTAPAPPAGLADQVITTALTHLGPSAGAPPAAPPVDEVSARRAARARRAGPVLAAAAAIVLVALGAFAIRNLDSGEDTATAGRALDAPDEGVAEAEEFDDIEADVALESADPPSEPAAAGDLDSSGTVDGASEFIVSEDLDEFEAAVRLELDSTVDPGIDSPATTLAPPAGAAEAEVVCAPTGPTVQADAPIVLSGSGELEGRTVSYHVFETIDGRVLVVSDEICGVIAEIAL